jgi:YD repeat-containing protein
LDRRREDEGDSLSRTTLLAVSSAISALFCVADVSRGETFLALDGQPGDFVAGHSLRFGPDDGPIAARRNVAGGVSLDAGGFTYDFAPPAGRPFSEGVFENAVRFPFNGPKEPGLNVAGRGRGCNRLTGRFRVLEATFDAAGEVIGVAIDFEQRCEGSAVALSGSLRFNAEGAGAGEPGERDEHELRSSGALDGALRMATLVAGPALIIERRAGPASDEVRDPAGRPLRGRDASGVDVWYAYDENGALREERYADCRIVRHTASPPADPPR